MDEKNLTRIKIDPHDVDAFFSLKTAPGHQMVLDAESTVSQICMDVLNVEFVRPWLYRELLDAEWYVRGIKRGYFSTGNVTYNDGILPLITQSMLVGTNLSIEGEFSKKDKEILTDQQEGKLSVGPFVVKFGDASAEIEQTKDLLRISSKTTQIMGYISSCVPLCPR